MKVQGKIVFETRVDDVSSIRVLLTQDADGKAGASGLTATLDPSGAFELEDERLDGWKVLYLKIYAGEALLHSAGPFQKKQWGAIKVEKVPAPAVAESPDSAVSIAGKVVDTAGVVQSYANYRVTVRYALKSEGGVEFSKDAMVPVDADGVWNAPLPDDKDHGVQLDEEGAIGFELIDNAGTPLAFECYVVAGTRETQKQNPKLSELLGATGGLGASRAKGQFKLRASRTLSKQALASAHAELRFRSAVTAPQPVQVERPAADNNKKVRGRVVDKAGKIQIRNCQVILYGTRHAPDAEASGAQAPAQQVLAICMTDGQGNFSAPYPSGAFAAASAIVGIKPDEIKEVFLDESGNYPDFVWLILESLPQDMTQEEHDDCACQNPTPMLPDMDELVQNSAYAQDIGGSCVNFTTPNRALEEYVYKMVVRTSDPDLFNLDERTLRERIADVNARIKFLQDQLGHVDYLPANNNLLAQALKPMESVAQQTHTTRRVLVKESAEFALAAHNLLVQTVNNPNVAKIRIAIASLQSELQKLNRLSSYRGRVPLDGSNPIDWDDSDHTLGVVQASTIAFGHILNFKQVWRAAGYSLGDLVYSLPLAPGQKKQIAVFDWDRTETSSRQESLKYNDSLTNSMSHTRDIFEIVNSNLTENQSASSHNKSKGSAMGAGVGGGTSGSAAGAGSYGGFSLIGAATGMLGISGGASKSSGESWSDASQKSMRNLAASTNQNLHDSTMQNAASMRSQRASVVTTVGQNESFSITTEVVANHNHCHALTIQYFEVLRHYAIYQELSDVQECLFIPMYIDGFDERKILRWRDILSTYLLAPRDKIANLHAGFDALQRQADADKGDPDAYADFPTGRYCDESLQDLQGRLQLELYIVRPPAQMPEGDNVTLEQKKEALIAAFNAGGLAWLPGIPEMVERLLNGLDNQIEENFQKELLWGQAPEEYVKHMRVMAVQAGSGAEIDLKLDISLVSKVDTGRNGSNPNQNRLGHFALTLSLRRTSATPSISRADVRAIVIRNDQILSMGSSCLVKAGNLQYNTEHYVGSIFSSDLINNDIAFGDYAYIATPCNKDELRNPRNEDRKNAALLIEHLNTNREHYHTKLWMLLDEQRLFNLLDKYSIQVPKPRYAASVKDGREVYGLVLDDDGQPVIDYEARSVASVVELKRIGMAGNSIIFPVARGLNLNKDFLLIPEYDVVEDVDIPESLAYMPIIVGKRLVSLKHKRRLSKIGEPRGDSRVNLLDIYKPLPGSNDEPKPYRVSVPTKGLFAEAVPGACNSCEKIDDSRFWKWEEHPIDEPTAIQPISTDSRREQPESTVAKDFPTPMINIQAAPAVPDPQGLANALMLMGKSDIFKDITGLDQTQKNALQSLLSNQEAAQFFAKQAAELAIESGRQTQHAADTVASYDLAKRGQKMQALEKINGLPVDSETKQKYYDQAIGQILDKDGGAADTLQQAVAAGKGQDGITSQNSIDHHADQGREVEASKNGEYVKISNGKASGSGGGTPQGGGGTGGSSSSPQNGGLIKWDGVPALQQTSTNTCWATAAAMMMSWKAKNPALKIVDMLQQAGQVYLDKYNSNQPLLSGEKEAFISALQMKGVEPASFPKSFYADLLQKFGPLWITTDARTAEGQFSPHARVLYAIQNGADAAGSDTTFSYLDPATGQSLTESFSAFVTAYEQMVTDNAGDLFIQIVHFRDMASGSGPVGEGGGSGGVTFEPDDAYDISLDLNTIELYASDANNLRTRIFDQTLAALENVNNKVMAPSPSEISPNLASALASNAWKFAKAQFLNGMKEVAPAEGAALGFAVDIIIDVYDEIVRAQKKAAAMDTAELIMQMRSNIANQKNAYNYQRVLADRLTREYFHFDSGGRGGYIADIQNAWPVVKALRPPTVEVAEVGLYCEWINHHFNNDAVDGTGFIALEFDSDGKRKSAVIMAPESAKIASRLNEIMSKAGIYQLMDLDVVKKLSRENVVVTFERDNRVRGDTLKPLGPFLKTPQNWKQFNRFDTD